MAIISFSIIFILIILSIVNINNAQMQYFPEKFIKDDFIIPENDKNDNYQYNLIDAKVLTNDHINLYIKKQGISLDRDDCCEGYQTLDAWGESIISESISDLKEIYSHAVYRSTSNVLTYKFPVQKIENENYILYHKLYIFDKGKGNPTCIIYFNNNRINYITINLNNYKDLVNLKINYIKSSGKYKVYYKNSYQITLDNINTIHFEFPNRSYSPAIALHWTYYKITLGKINFTIKGIGLCSNSNPCIKGYTCVGGLCEKCHFTCFDCKNGGLSTDCDTKCSPHSTLLTPIKGSCSLGYVDLTQFDSFTIQDMVPPPRNNRLTISFWIYISSFPENEIIGSVGDQYYEPKAKIYNNMIENMNITLYFTHNSVYYECGPLGSGSILSNTISISNVWYFVKCGSSPDHKERFLFIKYFKDNNFKYFYKKKK